VTGSVVRVVRRLDVGAVGVAGVDALEAGVVADPVTLAERAARGETPIVVVCLPGGGMSRRYFDLDLPGYSMAEHLARRGVVVAALDHPAVGGSDRPDDGWTLTPAAVADLDAAACRLLLDALRNGAFDPALAPLTGLVAVGVGHSMGGLLAAHVQARHRAFDALALLGADGGGLVPVLVPEELELAGRPDEARGRLAALVAARFGSPLGPGATSTSAFLVAVPVPDEALVAIGRAASTQLNLCGLASMLPGFSAPELGAIDVPVFVGVGDRDITGPINEVAAQLPRCGDLTLFTCPSSGHNHVIAPTRAVLWDRLGAWLDGLDQMRVSGRTIDAPGP
jgi:pimeloyl-ACP methyl ester carboxylesterase